MGNGVGDGVFHLQRGEDDDGQVDRIGNLANIAIGADAGDGLGPGVDRVEGAGEAAFEDIDEDVVADLAGDGGGADNRHRGRVEECVETLHDKLPLVMGWPAHTLCS